ncbi:MAG: hypothetical protein WCJ30_24850, partial [Deltaproteobacteria bacterium]
EGEPITHRFVTHAITRAQKKIEGINFEQRKRTLDYDNVMNKQRVAIYGLRREALVAEDLRRLLLDICHDFLAAEAMRYLREDEKRSTRSKMYDMDAFEAYVRAMVPGLDLEGIEEADEPTEDYLAAVIEAVGRVYDQRRIVLNPSVTRELARFVILHGIDNEWRNHLAAIDELREGIHLRSYAQLDPLIEYQREATYMFQDMMTQVQRIVFEHFFRMNVVTEEQRTANVDYGRGAAAAPRGSTWARSTRRARGPSRHARSRASPRESTALWASHRQAGRVACSSRAPGSFDLWFCPNRARRW